ncbi:hypothetical protein M0657_005807 [Pyricularia oryzae]|nr:hypothetical protein M0657_005807 [Pyricularia oryzae]KAI7924308.1 hypothetical protein M9X92_003925 [Pyricularia oryzae]QBZ62953.1 hypothetical protein PoMZ_11843 [Pyricularia oryzae]
MHRGCQEAIARRAADDAGTATANRKLARRYHPVTTFVANMRTGNTPDEDATESIIFSRVSTKRLIVKPVTYFDGKHLRTAISGEG